MQANGFSCRACGVRSGQVSLLRRLHGAGEAPVCSDCILEHAQDRASRGDPGEKALRIRKALDRGQEVWYDEKELFLIPSHVARLWSEVY